MMSLVNKSADWTPNYHKILIISPKKSLKSLRAARIDELADSNEPAKSRPWDYVTIAVDFIYFNMSLKKFKQDLGTG